MSTYKEAGVDIEGGDRFARFIASIKSPALGPGIGGFAGGMELDLSGYREPVMLSCTDGVGTKLLIAQKLKTYNTVGIDLVAMSVNDLIVCGAKPMLFLDYIAIGGLDESILHPLVEGIIAGCEDAKCRLAGGETAEMPDLYDSGEFDLAGFAVGMVEKSRMLPKKEMIRPGDSIIGLPSSGIHSNGLSLARKAIPESETGLLKELLTPTRIYVRELTPLIESGLVLGAAHITGGGLEGNIIRVLPQGLRPVLDRNWPVPSIFEAIQKHGRIDTEEMYRVFNMGIGIALVVPRAEEASLLKLCEDRKIRALPIGRVETENL
ncbi:phosphoribosylformylglycinamidine cyclo-ligase [Marispirochaeta aestuarii]|uniref:phosphoribosylformylglycinamidine cyclo-ligase n=1 Tax=Marispirochaeta aestuarii TaxID=1963862 RepID=UPI0029C943E9|nr:phosphoribosylformylglycinamidine cyclo-ligase [Marispirochaeta aestuarii]